MHFDFNTLKAMHRRLAQLNASLAAWRSKSRRNTVNFQSLRMSKENCHPVDLLALAIPNIMGDTDEGMA